MPVAARAANVVEGDADQCLGIAALHGRVEINDRVASVAGDDQPVMLGREGRAYGRPEPRRLSRG
jgi:formylmethanofuran dehydrogenase subunit C